MAFPIVDSGFRLVVALENTYKVSVGTFDGDDLFVCHKLVNKVFKFCTDLLF